ncbi:hypothetical protein METBIDRAFT_167299 [Metschnikowia bicuspidata var. bicuspidata NRRL YB-4993]|uniref:Uncharacterized protein n=1 Tax=Metschnikowia bicuspidata var. bicuspidata NRRL YB-4993 TaxID=869754 RepID=A0A1A0HA81_9ASCO|nr:hypothetical protein METBIDRAFT_167299 [Metschnikowia bicuspidata var. bicuspidata NRRL YB-4993]OBA20921.1 hypothetical protein METBIDRAFT_167299 [Metschnikowia bicuspidata var. bicuspidata NRRL YB-4993]
MISKDTTHRHGSWVVSFEEIGQPCSCTSPKKIAVLIDGKFLAGRVFWVMSMHLCRPLCHGHSNAICESGAARPQEFDLIYDCRSSDLEDNLHWSDFFFVKLEHCVIFSPIRRRAWNPANTRVFRGAPYTRMTTCKWCKNIEISLYQDFRLCRLLVPCDQGDLDSWAVLSQQKEQTMKSES